MIESNLIVAGSKLNVEQSACFSGQISRAVALQLLSTLSFVPRLSELSQNVFTDSETLLSGVQIV